MTDLPKLADELQEIADCNSALYHESRLSIEEAARILRSAAVDVAGLMALADKMAERRSIYDQDLVVMGNNADANHANLARFNLESALRLALAAREVQA